MTEIEDLLELPHDTDAPARARRYVAEHASHLPASVVQDAVLLVSEVVTNAIRYGRAVVTLRLRMDPPMIGIAVHDGGEPVPTLPSGQPDPSCASGRGLLIVAALASAWGIEESEPPPGKTVWFELVANPAG